MFLQLFRVIFPADLRRPRGVVSDRFAYILWEVMCLTVVAHKVMGPHQVGAGTTAST